MLTVDRTPRASGDSLDAIRWTYEPATVARARHAAATHGVDAASLLALLRAYAFHADGWDGSSSYPGARLLADELAIGRNRIPKLRDVLTGAGLLIDTGQRRGRGGAIVYRLDLPDPGIGTTKNGASSTVEDGASSPAESVTPLDGAASSRTVTEHHTQPAPNRHHPGWCATKDQGPDDQREAQAARESVADDSVEDVIRPLAECSRRRRLPAPDRARVVAALTEHPREDAEHIARDLDRAWRGEMTDVVGAFLSRLRSTSATDEANTHRRPLTDLPAEVAESWPAVLEHVEQHVGAHQSAVWRLAELQPVGADRDGVLVLEAPRGHGTMIRDRFKHVITGALDGRPVRIVEAQRAAA